MRVLHIGKFFPPHPGGIERCTADLCAALTARGAAVAVLAHGEPHAGRGERRTRGAEVTLAACHGTLLYAPLSPSFPWLLKRTIDRFRPDLLHLHVPNTSAFFALLVPAARRLPWIVHWHADIPLDSRRRLLRLAYDIYRPFEQALLKRASAIVATSASYLDGSAALAPWRAKAHVIPLGIGPLEQDEPGLDLRKAASSAGRDAAAGALDVDLRAVGGIPAAPRTQLPPLGWPRTVGIRILAVGRLSYFKGIDVLLRALANIADASLLVIGDGERRGSLERLVAELGIGARVRFAGRIDMDAAGVAAVAAAYANADVFCLPSIDRAESFGLVLLEAMRAGTAVVASAIPGSGVGFVVRDGETGLLVPPADVPALGRALRQLASDPSLRQRLGEAGRQRWREEFTLDRAADRMLELYRSLGSVRAGAAAAPAG